LLLWEIRERILEDPYGILEKEKNLEKQKQKLKTGLLSDGLL
jgi:hypothetical protein